MPKTKFKRNIHNLLLQELTEENEYIDLSDLPEYAFENRIYYICIIISASRVNLSHFPMNFVLFSVSFSFSFSQMSYWSILNFHSFVFLSLFILFCFFLWFHYLTPTSYLVQQLISMYCKIRFNSMRQTTVRPE